MHNISNIFLGQTNEQLQGKAALDATLQVVKIGQDPIRYLIIPKKLCFSNKSKKHPICSLCMTMRILYNKMLYTKKNTTNYLIRFYNSQNSIEACNGSLITRGFQEHGTKILFVQYATGFDALQYDNKNEAETPEEEILCAILYIENSDKSI